MELAGFDVVIWGITAAGKTFRPSDWTDRIAGLTSAFGEDRKLVYSPLVLPVMVDGARAVIVGHELEAIEPRLFRFLLSFAQDNELQVVRLKDALASPHGLVPPRRIGQGTPRTRVMPDRFSSPDKKMAPAGAFFFVDNRLWRYASALIAVDRRDFVRETMFLWTIFLSAILSITACDSCRVLAAAALSPVAMAFLTFLTAVRSADFWLALRMRVASACRARFLACAELAMDCLS